MTDPRGPKLRDRAASSVMISGSESFHSGGTKLLLRNMTIAGGGPYDEALRLPARAKPASAYSWRKKGSSCRPSRWICASVSNSRRNSARSTRNANHGQARLPLLVPLAKGVPTSLRLWPGGRSVVLCEFRHFLKTGDDAGEQPTAATRCQSQRFFEQPGLDQQARRCGRGCLFDLSLDL
jgi:hypothetical protein